jgi:hypothetical protein
MELSEQSITSGTLTAEQERLALIRHHVVEAFRKDPDPQNDQSGGFPPADNWFLRIAHTVSQAIDFKDREEFCNSCYRVSPKKIGFDLTTYPVNDYLDDVQRSLSGKIEKIPSLKAIESSGYPMKTPQDRGTVTHRVYVNPLPRHAAAVYGHLLDQRPSMFLSKLSDHEILTTCRDSFVVYVTSDAAFTRILEILDAYQQGHRDHFFDEIPVMTQPVNGLTGVGWAQDAPLYPNGGPLLDYHSKRAESDHAWAELHPWPMESAAIGLSHSEWRSVFVLAALRKSAGRDISALRTELSTIAAVAGLSPQTMFKTAVISAKLLELVENEVFPTVE